MYLSPSELKQLELLKKKTPTARFMMMVQLIQGQINAMKAGIKHQDPHLNEKEVEEHRRIRMMEIYFGKRWEEKFK